MNTFRQLRWTSGSPGVRCAILAILAACAATEALAQDPRLSNPAPDLFAPADPLNPQLPGSRSPSEAPNAAPTKSGGTKIGNGRTEITAAEANFEPDTHVAIFKDNVVLKDPDFNVVCDKLTAYLKHDAPAKPGAKPTPKKVVSDPGAAGKKGAVNPADDPHRTLDKAVAEMNPGGRLEITQDKVEADGSITHCVGHGSKAVYNAITGTTTLSGMPDATKGTDRVVATDEKTIIILLRDGSMSTVGPHKVFIVSAKPVATPTPAPIAQ